MDTKRLILGMSLAMAVILGVNLLTRYEQQKYPALFTAAKPKPEEPKPAATTGPAATQTASSQAATQSATTAPAASAPSLRVAAAQGRGADLGADDFDPIWDPAKTKNPYALGIRLDAQGAGIQRAVLDHFRKSLKKDEKDKAYDFELPYPHGGAFAKALATRWVSVDGVSCDLWNVDWKLTSDPHDRLLAVYEVDILDAAGKKILTLRKRFQLRDATLERDKGMGYEFDLTYELINSSGRDLHVKLAFNGPNTPMTEGSRYDQAEIFTGFQDGAVAWAPDPHPVAKFSDASEVDLKDKKGKPLLWIAQRSNYFSAILRTSEGGPEQGPYGRYFAKSFAPDPKGADADNKEVAIGYETDEMPLPAGATKNLPLHVFIGPTARFLLDSPYYSSNLLKYNLILVVTSSCCGFCTFPWLVNLLVSMLSMFHLAVRDWGLATIALVLVVRLLLHPITKKSQVSMTKMSKMAPEMERLKKKYGDDKEGLNKAMMGFYREQGITPIMGCLPMFLQMPIWIALWNALQSTFEFRQAPFLWGFTWIKDLSQPDQLMTFNFSFLGYSALNILPVLLAVVFFIQQKMQPKPDIKTLTPQQAQQQKMMQWMSLLFPIFLYGSPSGLNLYILASTTIGIFESKRIRDHIKEREAAQVQGKPPDEDAPRGGISGWISNWFANLQARAESARRDNSGGSSRKKRR